MKWTRRSLLGLNDLSREEIEVILDLAEEFKLNLTDKKKPVKTLSGMRVVNLFLEPSTRTRVAFEIAAKSLNADVISIASQSSSLTKGESLKDTALNIQALGADAIVIRHSSAGSPLFCQMSYRYQLSMLEMVPMNILAKPFLIYLRFDKS